MSIVFVKEKFDNFRKKAQGRVRLEPYQYDALKFGLSREFNDNDIKGGMICDDMGLGKTFEMIAICMGNEQPSTLFVVECNSRDQWVTAIFHLTGIRPLIISTSSKLRAIVASTPTTKSEPIYAVTTFSAFNYNPRGKKGTGNYPMVLKDTKWSRVVLDEGHGIRNQKTLLAKNIISLSSDIRWILTATPVHNGLGDLINQAAFIGVEICGTKESVDPFMAEYCIRRTNKEIAKNSPRLELPGIRIIDCISPTSSKAELMIRRSIKLDDVNTNVMTYIVFQKMATTHPLVYLVQKGNRILERDIDFGPDSMTFEFDIEKAPRNKVTTYHMPITENDGLDQLDGDDDRDDDDEDGEEDGESPRKIRRIMFKSNKNQDDDDGDGDGDGAGEKETEDVEGGPYRSSKMETVCAIMRKVKEKFVIFCNYKQEIEILSLYLEHNDISCVVYDGKKSITQKEEAIYNFVHAPNVSVCQVFIAQIDCCAYGLNLQVAHNVIIMQPAFNPITDIQAMHRCFRKGQDKIVNVFRLITEGTVEERISQVANHKIDVVAGVLGFGDLGEMFGLDKKDIDEIAKVTN